MDVRKDALGLAESLGADHALEAGPPADTAQAVRALTGGRGADVVLDCVGSEATMATAAAAARTLGDVTLVGIAGGTLPFNFYTVPYEVSFQSVYWGSRPELVEVLELGARGLVRAVVTTFPLERAAEAYRALAAGDISGRAVIIPNTGT